MSESKTRFVDPTVSCTPDPIPTPSDTDQPQLVGPNLSEKTPKEIYELGIQKFQEGEYDQAIMILLQSETNNISVQYALGRCYMEKNDFDQAKTWLEKALSQNIPKFQIAILNDLAMGYLIVEENHEKALKHLQTAYNLDANNPQTLTNYGICLYKIKQYEMARKFFRKTLEIEPQNTLVLPYLENINRIQFYKTDLTPNHTP